MALWRVRPWEVVSPEYETIAQTDEEPFEPAVRGCHVVYVLARTRHGALRRGLKAMGYRSPVTWPAEAEATGVNPYDGLEANLARCRHGHDAFAAIDDDGEPVWLPCAQCEDEADKAWRAALTPEEQVAQDYPGGA